MKRLVHYIFSTYKRKHVLTDEIAEELGLIFKSICKEKGFKLLVHSVLLDHVHMLIEKDSDDRNEYVMKLIKGKSAFLLFKKFPTNRLVFRKLWGRGYRAISIGGKDQLDQVIDYIRDQKIKGVDKRAKPDWKPRRLVAGFNNL